LTHKDGSIIREVLPYWLGIVGALGSLFMLIGDIQGVYSVLLGSVASLLALRQLIEDQTVILLQSKRRRVFFSFIGRLAIYAIPVVIGLRYPVYFKFWVILVCLFTSQLIFIIRELIINYKRYQKRMHKNG
tara:strand:+ start:222 stop:614 length:393 start_codon:yes stop_codon:yes gene_type:complete